MFIYHENASAVGSFTRTGDAYAVNEDLWIAAVADSPLRELLRSPLRRYPQDDHGLDAAQLFCDTMVAELAAQIRDSGLSKTGFVDALNAANQQIALLNKSLGRTQRSYLTYDWAETVGVAAVQVGNKLIYGGLEDCYVMVFRGNNPESIAPFDYQITKAGKYVEKVTAAKKYAHEFPSELVAALAPDALWEPVWCNVLRNNFDIRDENENQVGWGCFTGEDSAAQFFQVHEFDLLPGDHIAVISDGMLPVVNHPELWGWFLANAKSEFRLQKSFREKILGTLGQQTHAAHKEKTLIYWQYR